MTATKEESPRLWALEKLQRLDAALATVQASVGHYRGEIAEVVELLERPKQDPSGQTRMDTEQEE